MRQLTVGPGFVGSDGAFDVALQNNNKILITGIPFVDVAKTLTGAAVTKIRRQLRKPASYSAEAAHTLTGRGAARAAKIRRHAAEAH
jgi:hypothetical protein